MSKRRVILGLAIAFAGLVVAYVAVICPAAKARAESRSCASAITSICLSAKCWALDHGGFMPVNFISMSNEISAPKILSCLPARRARTEDWSAFSPENCTYEIVTPGMRIEETNKVFLRCKVHGHLGYSDTTVFDGTRRHGKFD